MLPSSASSFLLLLLLLLGLISTVNDGVDAQAFTTKTIVSIKPGTVETFVWPDDYTSQRGVAPLTPSNKYVLEDGDIGKFEMKDVAINIELEILNCRFDFFLLSGDLLDGSIVHFAKCRIGFMDWRYKNDKGSQNLLRGTVLNISSNIFAPASFHYPAHFDAFRRQLVVYPAVVGIFTWVKKTDDEKMTKIFITKNIFTNNESYSWKSMIYLGSENTEVGHLHTLVIDDNHLNLTGGGLMRPQLMYGHEWQCPKVNGISKCDTAAIITFLRDLKGIRYFSSSWNFIFIPKTNGTSGIRHVISHFADWVGRSTGGIARMDGNNITILHGGVKPSHGNISHRVNGIFFGDLDYSDIYVIGGVRLLSLSHNTVYIDLTPHYFWVWQTTGALEGKGPQAHTVWTTRWVSLPMAEKVAGVKVSFAGDFEKWITGLQQIEIVGNTVTVIAGHDAHGIPFQIDSILKDVNRLVVDHNSVKLLARKRGNGMYVFWAQIDGLRYQSVSNNDVRVMNIRDYYHHGSDYDKKYISLYQYGMGGGGGGGGGGNNNSIPLLNPDSEREMIDQFNVSDTIFLEIGNGQIEASEPEVLRSAHNLLELRVENNVLVSRSPVYTIAVGLQIRLFQASSVPFMSVFNNTIVVLGHFDVEGTPGDTGSSIVGIRLSMSKLKTPQLGEPDVDVVNIIFENNNVSLTGEITHKFADMRMISAHGLQIFFVIGQNLYDVFYPNIPEGRRVNSGNMSSVRMLNNNINVTNCASAFFQARFSGIDASFGIPLAHFGQLVIAGNAIRMFNYSKTPLWTGCAAVSIGTANLTLDSGLIDVRDNLFDFSSPTMAADRFFGVVFFGITLGIEPHLVDLHVDALPVRGFVTASLTLDFHTVLVRANRFIVGPNAKDFVELLSFRPCGVIRFQHVVVADNLFQMMAMTSPSRDDVVIHRRNSGLVRIQPALGLGQARTGGKVGGSLPDGTVINIEISCNVASVSIEQTLRLVRNTIDSPSYIIPLLDFSNIAQVSTRNARLDFSIGEPLLVSTISGSGGGGPPPPSSSGSPLLRPLILDEHFFSIQHVFPTYADVVAGRQWQQRLLMEVLERDAWSADFGTWFSLSSSWSSSSSSVDVRMLNQSEYYTQVLLSTSPPTDASSSSSTSTTTTSSPNKDNNHNNGGDDMNGDGVALSSLCTSTLLEQEHTHGLYTIRNQVDMAEPTLVPKRVRPFKAGEIDVNNIEAAVVFNFAVGNLSLNGTMCSAHDTIRLSKTAFSSSAGDRPIIFAKSSPKSAFAQNSYHSTLRYFPRMVWENFTLDVACGDVSPPSSSASSQPSSSYHCVAFSDTSFPDVQATKRRVVVNDGNPRSSSSSSSASSIDTVIIVINSNMSYTRLSSAVTFAGFGFAWPLFDTTSSSSSSSLSMSVENTTISVEQQTNEVSVLLHGASSGSSSSSPSSAVTEMLVFAPVTASVSLSRVVFNLTNGKFVAPPPSSSSSSQQNWNNRLACVTLLGSPSLGSAQDVAQLLDQQSNKRAARGGEEGGFIWHDVFFHSNVQYLTSKELVTVGFIPSSSSASLLSPQVFFAKGAWGASKAAKTDVHCFAFNGYQQRSGAPMFDPVRVSSSPIDGGAFFKPCPGSESLTLSQSVSVVPECGDLLLEYRGPELDAGTVLAKSSRSEKVTATFFLIAARVRDTPSPLGFGRIVPADMPERPGVMQSEVFTVFREKLGQLRGDYFVKNSSEQQQQRQRDQEASSHLASSDHGVAFVVDGVAGARRAITVNLKFVATMDPQADHTFDVLIHPSLLACRFPDDADNQQESIEQVVKRAEKINTFGGGGGVYVDPESKQMWYKAPLKISKRHRGFNSDIEKAGRISAGVGMILGGLAGSPLVGAAMAKAGAVLQFADCSFSMTEPLMFIESPFGLGFGAEYGYFRRGACVGNMLLVMLIVFLLLNIAYVRVYASRRRHRMWTKKYNRDVEMHRRVLDDGGGGTTTIATGEQDGSKSRNRGDGDDDGHSSNRRHTATTTTTTPAAAASASPDPSPSSPLLSRHASLKALRELKKKKETSEPKILHFSEAMYLAKLPATLVIPVTILTQGTLGSAIALLLSPVNNNDIFIGVVFTLAHVVFLFWMVHVVAVQMLREPWLVYEIRPPSWRRYWGDDDPTLAAGDAEQQTRILFSDCALCRPALKQMQKRKEQQRQKKEAIKTLRESMRLAASSAGFGDDDDDDAAATSGRTTTTRRQDASSRFLLGDSKNSFSLLSSSTSGANNNFSSFAASSFLLRNNNNRNHQQQQEQSGVFSLSSQAGDGDDFGSNHLGGQASFGEFIIPKRDLLHRRSLSYKAKVYFFEIQGQYGDWLMKKPSQQKPSPYPSLEQRRENQKRQRRQQQEEEEEEILEDTTFFPRTADVFILSAGHSPWYTTSEYVFGFVIAVLSGIQTSLDDCEVNSAIVAVLNVIPFSLIVGLWPFADRLSNIFSLAAAALLMLMSLVTSIGDITRIPAIVNLVSGLNFVMGIFGMFKSAFDVALLAMTFESWALLPFFFVVHVLFHENGPLSDFKAKLHSFFVKREEKKKVRSEEKSRRRELHRLFRESEDDEHEYRRRQEQLEGVELNIVSSGNNNASPVISDRHRSGYSCWTLGHDDDVAPRQPPANNYFGRYHHHQHHANGTVGTSRNQK